MTPCGTKKEQVQVTTHEILDQATPEAYANNRLSELTNYLSLGYFTCVFFGGWGGGEELFVITIYRQIIPNITTNSKFSACQNYLGGLGSGYK